MSHNPIKTTAAIAIVAVIVGCISSVTLAKDKPFQSFKYRPVTGDILFQTSKSQLGPALEIATGSKLTHCGVALYVDDTMFVYEAVGPVRRVPLDEWIRLGVDENFAVKRLENHSDVLLPDVVDKMIDVFDKFEGRDYDVQFNWSDERLYCSELVYKMFERGADVRLGKIQKFGEMNLDDDLVKFWLNVYFPDGADMDEDILTPVSIYNDTTLITVFSTY
jgi:hypothetical protein